MLETALASPSHSKVLVYSDSVDIHVTGYEQSKKNPSVTALDSSQTSL